jgi:hypothetical protein
MENKTSWPVAPTLPDQSNLNLEVEFDFTFPDPSESGFPPDSQDEILLDLSALPKGPPPGRDILVK